MSNSNHRHRHRAQTSLLPRGGLIAKILAVAVLALAAVSGYAHYNGDASAAPSRQAAKGAGSTDTAGSGTGSATASPGTASSGATKSGTPTPKPTVLWTLPASPTAPSPPVLSGYVLAVQTANSTVTGACTAGTSVQVTAANANVTLTGHCATVVITASGVHLALAQFDNAYISGANNTVTYSKSGGPVTNIGAGNTVTKS